MSTGTDPYFTAFEQFYKLADSGKHHEDYERQMFVTPFGTLKKAGFVVVIEGFDATLLCLNTGNDYWRGIFYDGEKAKVVFDTTKSKQSKDARSFANALFVCLESEECGKRVSDQQFAVSEKWNGAAHWIGSSPK